MIKNYFYVFFLLATVPLFSQELYFNTGKNFTKYIYKDENLQMNPNIQSGTGNFYEVGLTKPFINEKYFYEFGLALNEYNAVGGNSASSYRWDTQYLGVHGGLMCSLLYNKNNPKNLDVLLKTGLDASTIIYGKQQINGIYYDLINQKEFSGIVLQSSVGFKAKYAVHSFGALSLGYDFCQTINITNSSKERLSFSSHQLELGIYFNIN